MAVTESPPLQQFLINIAQLKGAFLPAAKGASYSDKEETAAKAFLVFAHAELEDYFEKACRMKANKALYNLQTTGLTDITALSLMIYCGEKISKPTEIAKYKEREKDKELLRDFPQFNPLSTRTILGSLKAAINVHSAICSKNNGVKEANILPMVLPIGLDPFKIESLWILALNNFGVARGSHAHNGLSSVGRIDDPFDVEKKLNDIIDGPIGSVPSSGSAIQVYSLRSLDLFLQS